MPDQSFASNQTAKLTGLMALIRELDLPVRPPTVQSLSRSGAGKTLRQIKPTEIGRIPTGQLFREMSIV